MAADRVPTGYRSDPVGKRVASLFHLQGVVLSPLNFFLALAAWWLLAQLLAPPREMRRERIPRVIRRRADRIRQLLMVLALLLPL